MNVVTGDNEGLDATALKFSRIWAAIKPYTQGEPGNVVFRVWCRQMARRSLDDGTWPATSILADAWERFGRRVGFEESSAEVFLLSHRDPEWNYTDNWEQAVRDLVARPGEEDVDEQGEGNDQVRVYPVRTRLSRLLYHDADCVVNFGHPYDEVDLATTPKAMSQYLPQLFVVVQPPYAQRSSLPPSSA